MLKRIALAVTIVILSHGQSFSANLDLNKTEKTPSASEVVERFIAAIGGRSAWLKITSQFASGHVEILGVGHTATYEVYTKPPNQTLLVMRQSSGEMKLGFDGQRAWHQIARNEAQYDAPEKQAVSKRNSDLFKYLNFKKHFPRAKVTGIGDVEGSQAYIVEAFPAGEKFPERLYFEVGTGLLVRSDTYTHETGRRAGPSQIVTYHLDYRTVDGIKLAFVLVINQPQVTIISRHSRVENNLFIDDRIFRKPFTRDDLRVEPETHD